jgi:hypothetical protein
LINKQPIHTEAKQTASDTPRKLDAVQSTRLILNKPLNVKDKKEFLRYVTTKVNYIETKEKNTVTSQNSP